MGWSDSPNEESWLIQRKDSFPEPYRTLATLPAGTTRYVDRTVECGREYAYRVIAISCGGSAASPIVRFTVPDCDRDARTDRPTPPR